MSCKPDGAVAIGPEIVEITHRCNADLSASASVIVAIACLSQHGLPPNNLWLMAGTACCGCYVYAVQILCFTVSALCKCTDAVLYSAT